VRWRWGSRRGTSRAWPRASPPPAIPVGHQQLAVAAGHSGIGARLPPGPPGPGSAGLESRLLCYAKESKALHAPQVRKRFPAPLRAGSRDPAAQHSPGSSLGHRAVAAWPAPQSPTLNTLKQVHCGRGHPSNVPHPGGAQVPTGRRAARQAQVRLRATAGLALAGSFSPHALCKIRRHPGRPSALPGSDQKRFGPGRHSREPRLYVEACCLGSSGQQWQASL